jgi:hypothetical protein
MGAPPEKQVQTITTPTAGSNQLRFRSMRNLSGSESSPVVTVVFLGGAA